MDVPANTNIRLSKASWLLLIILLASNLFKGSLSSSLSQCDNETSSQDTMVLNVEVRFINTTAVNISWTQPNSAVEEYTVYYSPIAVTNQNVNRTIQSKSFTGTNGIIADLVNDDRDIKGYDFLVVVGNGSQCDSLDTRTVVSLLPILSEATTTGTEESTSRLRQVPVDTIVTVIACVVGTFILYTIVLVVVVFCYRRSQTQIKRLKKEVMAVNELDFPNPGIIGDASEYKVSPLYPMDTLSSEHQSSATADIERETVFANKGTSGRIAE